MPAPRQTIVGVFENNAKARAAEKQLMDEGFDPANVTVSADGGQTTIRVRTDEDHENDVIDIFESNGSVNLDHREGTEDASGLA